ncbi:MAG: NifU N-terminal domain-containing protein [Myxococcota bacterium]|nr:NifU N-terminal domain-containing protein [Myxococcota bacterium]
MQTTSEPVPETTPPSNPPVQSDPVVQESPSPSTKTSEEAQTNASDIDVEPIETPNPNAYKFKVNTTVAKVSFSVASLEDAKENALAKDLIQLDGVSSIFGVHDFVTVTKKNTGDWDDLIPQITKRIQLHLSK